MLLNDLPTGVTDIGSHRRDCRFIYTLAVHTSLHLSSLPLSSGVVQTSYPRLTAESLCSKCSCYFTMERAMMLIRPTTQVLHLVGVSCKRT